MNALSEYVINANWHKSIFLLIEFINIIVFVFSGVKIMHLKNKSNYWKIAILPIISYGICKGLRFGRDIDYNLYYDGYIWIGEDFFEANHELLFKCINWLFYQAGAPYQCIILFCSIFLIYVLMLFIKDNVKLAPLVLLFFIIETKSADNYIRWYLSFSFFFLSYLYLEKKENNLSIIFSLCALFTHIGIIVLYPILLFFKLLNKQLLSSKIVIGLFLVSLVLGEAQFLNFLVPYADIIFSISEKTQVYASRLEDLLAGNWSSGYMEISLITSIKYFLAYSFPLYYYPKCVSIIKQKSFIAYNMFCLGLITFPIFNTMELFDRYSKSLMFFSIIISSFSFYIAFKSFKRLFRLERLFCLISFAAAIYPIFSFFFKDYKWYNTLFIWDAGKLYSLPTWLFIN